MQVLTHSVLSATSESSYSYDPSPMGKGPEAQRGPAACLRSHSRGRSKLDLNSVCLQHLHSPPLQYPPPHGESMRAIVYVHDVAYDRCLINVLPRKHACTVSVMPQNKPILQVRRLRPRQWPKSPRLLILKPSFFLFSPLGVFFPEGGICLLCSVPSSQHLERWLPRTQYSENVFPVNGDGRGLGRITQPKALLHSGGTQDLERGCDLSKVTRASAPLTLSFSPCLAHPLYFPP